MHIYRYNIHSPVTFFPFTIIKHIAIVYIYSRIIFPCMSASYATDSI